MNTTGAVRPSAVHGDIFIPIPAHAGVIDQAMMLAEIVIPISDATKRGQRYA